MTKASEQRKFKRLPIRSSVYVFSENLERFKTHTMDFSDGGLFIEGKVLSLLKVDTIIQIQSAEAFENPPVLNARVAWTNRYGAGIQYLLDK
jgi:hypothetical protein